MHAGDVVVYEFTYLNRPNACHMIHCDCTASVRGPVFCSLCVIFFSEIPSPTPHCRADPL